MADSASWVPPTPEPDPGCRARLYCFPHAGGASGTYRAWTTELRPDIQVCPVVLPGRDTRVGEPMPPDMDTLATAAAHGLAAHLDTAPGPAYAVFGHSLGAITAYETARRLAARGRPPLLLVASGSEAPDRVAASTRGRHLLPDDAFVAEVARLGGSADAGPHEAELLRALLPRLRADYTIAETYTHVPGASPDCPIVVYVGTEDTSVDESGLRAWARLGRPDPPTSGVRRLPGGHLYLDDARPFVLRALRRDLGAVLDAS